MKPSELYNLSDAELLERGSGAQAGSTVDRAIQMEFHRRAYVAQIESGKVTLEAAKAARDAAKAAQDTALWTKYSAMPIALSVVVMAIGTFV
ncbi:MAG: hypothetical protein ABJN11_05815 [Lentilitoribacter sp.]